MRMLAGFGVFKEGPPRQFALTPVGELLKTDAPGSLRYMAMMFGEEFSTRAYEHITACLRTGGDGVSEAYGKQIWEVLAERPEQCETFQRAMTKVTAISADAIVEAYDFSGIKRLADVGGGSGHAARDDPSGQSEHARRAVRSARGGRRRADERFAGCEGRIVIESGKLLRARARRLRRLSDEAHHPRLERRALPHHPLPHPREAAEGRPGVGLRDGGD